MKFWSKLNSFSFKKMHLKISSEKWWPFCLGLNVIKATIMTLLIAVDWETGQVISQATFTWLKRTNTLRWRHNGLHSVPNHQPHNCLLKRSFGHRSKNTSKLPVTGLCVGNSPVTGEFPAQMASNAENVSIWWRHHDFKCQNEFIHVGIPRLWFTENYRQTL